MIPYQIKYENHLGEELWLDDSRFFININDLRNFAWSYDINNRPNGFGGRVTRFTRGVTERSIRVGVRGRELDFVNRIEKLHALTEIDILANKPGRLWLKEEYIRCYLAVSSDLNTYSRRGYFAEKEMTVLLVDPFWTREIELRFEEQEQLPIITDAKRYLGRNPMKYAGTKYAISTINNEHYASCSAIIIFDSAGENPSAVINGHTYQVGTTIKAGEKVIINQLEKTLTHVTTEGRETNIFDLRNKSEDVFMPIASGEQDVLYRNAFTLVLLQQRSEPRWN